MGLLDSLLLTYVNWLFVFILYRLMSDLLRIMSDFVMKEEDGERAKVQTTGANEFFDGLVCSCDAVGVYTEDYSHKFNSSPVRSVWF